MKAKEFKCIQCGKCCSGEIAICITYSDLKRWKEQNRYDIIREVSFLRIPKDKRKDHPLGEGFYIATTVSKIACPFLGEKNGKSICTIHHTKPRACKDAPDGFNEKSNFNKTCPVWNYQMNNPKRVRKIQAKQDRDFKACVTHFEELLNLTIGAKGWRLKINM
jgi:Fe-S-cluster containining protein